MQEEFPVSVDLEYAFPGLRGTSYEITSRADRSYNCIAWAAGDASRWWWPDDQNFWPKDVTARPSLAAFSQVFARLGYEVCENASMENGWEKIAIYAMEDGSPTHAARQLPDGSWTSKLGRAEDISHVTLDSICGDRYGKVAILLRRRGSTGSVHSEGMK